MSQPVVLITSATGRIGKELVARLSQSGEFTVRACSFSPGKADDLRTLGADEVVHFDLNDATTWVQPSTACLRCTRRRSTRCWKDTWPLAKP